MMLSDRTHQGGDREGAASRIDPLDPEDIQPASVDVHIDRVFRVFKVSSRPYIDVREPMDDLTEEVVIDDDQPFFIHPGEFVLASTLRGADAAGRHPGAGRGQEVARAHRPADPRDGGVRRPRLDGQLTLELSNVAKMPIALYFGMKIGQLSFVRMSTPVDRPYGSAEPPQQVPGPDGADAEPRLHGVRGQEFVVPVVALSLVHAAGAALCLRAALGSR